MVGEEHVEVGLAVLLLVFLLVLVQITFLGQVPIAVQNLSILAPEGSFPSVRTVMIVEITKLPCDIPAGGRIFSLVLPVALNEFKSALCFGVGIREDSEMFVT